MNVGVAGIGWVTPLGAELDAVWKKVMAAERAAERIIVNPETGRKHRFIPVADEIHQTLARVPRLRRSSAISYLAVAAGMAALDDAGENTSKTVGARTAVVLAVCDGGVLYTRRFYEQIVKHVANNASPLLFPETVYNAPASHLAALLQVDGASYTLVGDSSVGLTALHFGVELLSTGEAEQVLLVGAEEGDWILCEAYHTWRLSGTPLVEGAAAVLLRRGSGMRLQTTPAVAYSRRSDGPQAIDWALSRLRSSSCADLVISSSNRSFVDRVEEEVLATHCEAPAVLRPKETFGEAPGASALISVVLASLALRHAAARRVLISAVGFSHHAAAALLHHPELADA